MSEQKAGFQKVKIISICPDEYWLQDVLSVEEQPEYVWTDRNGVGHCMLHIYFQDSLDNVFKSEIFLKNELKKGKTENYLYVNQIGDNQWVTNEEQLFDNFKHWVQIISWGINGEKIEKYKPGATPFEKEIVAKKDYHIAVEGEEILLQFLKNYYNYNNYDTDANVFLDIDKIFLGDFSSLQHLVGKNDFDLVLFTYLNKKMEQKVLNYYFPLPFFRDVCNNMQISNTYKKQYGEFLKKLEYIDGYWELSRFKTFTPIIKNVKPEDSEY